MNAPRGGHHGPPRPLRTAPPAFPSPGALPLSLLGRWALGGNFSNLAVGASARSQGGDLLLAARKTEAELHFDNVLIDDVFSTTGFISSLNSMHAAVFAATQTAHDETRPFELLDDLDDRFDIDAAVIDSPQQRVGQACDNEATATAQLSLAPRSMTPSIVRHTARLQQYERRKEMYRKKNEHRNQYLLSMQRARTAEPFGQRVLSKFKLW